VIKQIDSRIKYYSDYIKDVKASRGVSSEENAYLVNKIQGLATLKAATSSKYGDTVVGQAKPLSAQDQKFYDSFDADLTKVSRTLDQIRASKPTREKMEAARQDLARVIPQYDSTLNQAISRGFDKAAGQTFKLKIDNLKRIAGIPLNQK
jgi:myo-inositol-1-phosphate synthase